MTGYGLGGMGDGLRVTGCVGMGEGEYSNSYKFKIV